MSQSTSQVACHQSSLNLTVIVNISQQAVSCKSKLDNSSSPISLVDISAKTTALTDTLT